MRHCRAYLQCGCSTHKKYLKVNSICSKTRILPLGTYLFVQREALRYGLIWSASYTLHSLRTVFCSSEMVILTTFFVYNNKLILKFGIHFAAAKSGSVGLAILSSINLVGMCQWGMRQTAELENQMTSVERIVEYAELPSEPALESDEKDAPPKDWPKSGNIAFKALTLRYAENGTQILRNLTFHVEAKVSCYECLAMNISCLE